MTSWQRRCISGLPRCTEAKSRSSAEAPEAMDEAAPPPRPMSMAGPPSTTSGVPAGKRSFCDVLRADVAETAGQHDGLVVAAQLGAVGAGHLLLEGAEIAAQVGTTELVVEGGRADGALEHDVQRRDDAPGLAVVHLPGLGQSGMRRLETEKPVRPAFGLAPRPVAPSSRISPPEPVAAPGKGEMAVGWLWVSTFIRMWMSSSLKP